MPLLQGREQSGNGQSGGDPIRVSDNGVVHPALPHSPAEAREHLAPPTLLAKPTVAGLLIALRRRLALALPLGIALGILAGIAAWKLTPGNKAIARAMVRIDSDPDVVANGSSYNAGQFANYQKTQMSLIKSQAVLADALRNPAIAALGIVRGQSSPTEWLAEALEADFKQGPEVLRLSLPGDQTDETVPLVNAIVQAYLDSRHQSEEERRQQRIAQLTDLRAKNERQLEEKRRALAAVDPGLVSPDPTKPGGLYEAKLHQLEVANEELRQLQIERQKLEAKTKSQRAHAADDKTPVSATAVAAEISNDKSVKQLQEEISRQESLIEVIKSKARTPEIADELLRDRGALEALAASQTALDERLRTLRPAIEARFREQAERERQFAALEAAEQLTELADRESKVKQRVAALTTETQAFGEALVKVNQAAKDIAEQETNLRNVDADLRALDLKRAAPARLSLLDGAVVTPPRLSKLQVGVTIQAIIAALAGTLLVVGWWEFRQRRIDSVDEVIHGFHVDVVGALPNLPRSGRLGNAAWTGASRGQRCAAAMQAFLALLLRRESWDKSGVVLVTSAQEGEDRSAVARLLAECLARSGRRTLLLDARVGQSARHHVAAAEASDLTELIQAGPITGLWFFGAGDKRRVASHPATADFGKLLDQLKPMFDVIVLDAGSVLSASDAIEAMPYVDGVIFTIRRRFSRMPQVSAALQQLRLLGAPVCGAVLVGTNENAYGSAYQLAAPTAY